MQTVFHSILSTRCLLNIANLASKTQILGTSQAEFTTHLDPHLATETHPETTHTVSDRSDELEMGAAGIIGA